VSATVPVTLLRLRAASQALDVEWADGTIAELPYRMLRRRCPCAACRQQRNVAGPFEAAGEVQVTGIEPYGPNAVRLSFSDGHDRGIFPFAYLRELRGAEHPCREHGY
jgi:DUF971 family protein